MELKTLSEILNRQIQDGIAMEYSIQGIASEVSRLTDQENGIAEVNPQVKSLMGTANILMQSINAQNVLIQQTIDAISQLVN